jgi:nucleoside-diphosphate-sugar epimerase
MKIFLAGATGAIGRPLVARLVAVGGEVVGMTRSPESARVLVALGATPELADALDLAAVRTALMRARPEVVVEQLTALPRVNTPEARQAAAAQHARVRRVGGAYLQEAARAAGARRYVAQSSAFWCSPGPGLADETVPLLSDGPAGVVAGAAVLADLERRVLGEADLEGIVLRYGFFYGPGTWYAPDGSTAELVRLQRFPIVGDGHGVWSFVHVEDAAMATVSALERAGTGIYHVVDDQPSELRVWLPAYARWLGAPAPPAVPITEDLLQRDPDGVFYATRLRGASNARARQALDFRPRPLEWLVGPPAGCA